MPRRFCKFQKTPRNKCASDALDEDGILTEGNEVNEETEAGSETAKYAKYAKSRLATKRHEEAEGNR